jgi:hypothetical protein
MKRARLSLLVVMLLTSLVMAGMQAQAVFQKDPGTWDGSCSDFKCDWCCQVYCGCSSPGQGWYFIGWCACSPVECNRSCEWAPAS